MRVRTLPAPATLRHPLCLVLLALRKTHKNKKLTQAQCAKMLYVTPRTIGDWEHPKRSRLTNRQMKAVYTAFGVTPQEAQTRTDEYMESISPKPIPTTSAPESYEDTLSVTGECPHRKTNLQKYAHTYHNTIIGLGPEGHIITLHAVIDRLFRATYPMPAHHCDALLRYVESKRGNRMSQTTTPEQELI